MFDHKGEGQVWPIGNEVKPHNCSLNSSSPCLPLFQLRPPLLGPSRFSQVFSTALCFFTSSHFNSPLFTSSYFFPTLLTSAKSSSPLVSSHQFFSPLVIRLTSTQLFTGAFYANIILHRFFYAHPFFTQCFLHKINLTHIFVYPRMFLQRHILHTDDFNTETCTRGQSQFLHWGCF